MAEPLRDELLSAYLDDALSVADRNRVERHLAANPEDRRLVDDLRVMRKSLQSLPRHELPATFRDKVLRQAERAVLTQPVEAPAASQANPPRRPKWLPIGDYRTLAWPAVALAVAIMLMVVYHERPDKMREVGQIDKPRNGAAEGESGGMRPSLGIRPRDEDQTGSETDEMLRREEGLVGDGLARENRAIVAKQPVATRSGLGRGILLVQVDVTRRAAKDDAFEKLLDRQQIVPQQQQFVPLQKRDESAPTAGRRQLERSTDDTISHERKAVGKAPTPSKPSDWDETGPVPESVEVFYVEATERQVQAALEDLKKRGDEFPAFAVQPDPTQPRQARFGTYERGRQGENWRHYFAVRTNPLKVNTDPAERAANRSAKADREDGGQEELSAVRESRDSYGDHRIERGAAQQVQEADGDHDNGRQGVQQAPAATAPEGRLSDSQATQGRGGRGRSNATRDARPLQIVFLLRVVDHEPAATADAVPDEPK